MNETISYDELYYLVNEKNESAEILLFQEVEKYLGWLVFAKSNDFLREEDVLSYGWQGYIEAFAGYNENNTTTFKSFLQHCVSRRLIDVQRKRNKHSLKAHMSSLLMSEETVQYAVESTKTFKLDETRMHFKVFWKGLSRQEQKIFYAYLAGAKPVELAEQFSLTESVIYKKLRTLREKLKSEIL